MNNYKKIERYPEYEINSKGDVRNISTGRTIRPTITNGHLKIKLKNKTEYIARLVAETFIEKENHKTDVRHIDGDKMNTIDKNLEWATHAETQYDSFGLGINAPGGNMPAKPIYDEKTGKEYPSIKACSRDTKVAPVTIRRMIRKNKRFKLL